MRPVFIAMVIACGAALSGCAEQVAGTATVDPAEVSAYRTEVAEAATADALAGACGTFTASAGPAVTVFNEFIQAHDDNAPDYVAKRDAATESLETAAEAVDRSITDAGEALPPELGGKLTEYSAAARALAEETREMSFSSLVEDLNAASIRINDARSAVNEDCSAR